MTSQTCKGRQALSCSSPTILSLMFAKWRRRAPIDDEERAPLLSAAAAVPSQLAAARPQDDDLLLRLGSAFGAIQAGKLPSTDQTCHALQSLLDSSLLQVDAPAVVEPSRLSTAGRQVVEDIRTLLEAVIVALKAKNGALWCLKNGLKLTSTRS